MFVIIVAIICFLSIILITVAVFEYSQVEVNGTHRAKIAEALYGDGSQASGLYAT